MTVPELTPRLRWRRALERVRSIRPRPGSDEQLPWLVPVLGLVVLVIVAGGALWFTLDWLERVAAVKVDQSTAIYGKDYVTAKLDAVKIALSVVAGGCALFALYLAVRRQRTAERDLRARLDAQAHTEDDAKARRVTELYTKAADQLGSDKAPVRLAGLYALERLGQDNPNQRPTIANLWCAYLRMPYNPSSTATHPPGGVPCGPKLRNPRRRTGIQRPVPATTTSLDPATAHAEAVLERDVRLSVQRLLAKHLRPRPDDNDEAHDDYWPEIPGLDLTEATLIDFDLSSCVLPPFRMDRGTFTGIARFDSATFTGDVWFDGVTFTSSAGFDEATFAQGAAFVRAVFAGPATFKNATFTGEAAFRDTTFTSGARFNETAFAGPATFKNATFTGETAFRDTTFASGVRFDGATFNGIASFDRTTLAGAAWFDGTTFNGPAGFHRATLAGSAWFDHTTFAGDAWFDGATFIDSARFGGATFTGVALFGSATFTSSARFEGATFTSGASFNRTTFTGDVCFDRVTFKYKARFDEATFNKSAQFFGATFNNSAQFDGATFTSAVWFDRATFPSYARLGGAVFTSTATCRSARIQLAEGCTSQGTWPEGWTCVPAESSTSEDGQWMQLVPVPVVLDRRVVVDARTEES